MMIRHELRCNQECVLFQCVPTVYGNEISWKHFCCVREEQSTTLQVKFREVCSRVVVIMLRLELWPAF